jgi:F0F1-type ATP synthase assembly protein I
MVRRSSKPAIINVTKHIEKLGFAREFVSMVAAFAVLAKTFAPFPRRGIFHIIRPLCRCPRIALGVQNQMHWLQLFILGWLSFGLTTVVFMFWLCQRTAAAIKDPIMPAALSPQRAEFGASKLSSELRSA